MARQEAAAELQHACRVLQPRYELGPAAAERFDAIALGLLLDPDTDAESILVTEVEQASDMLCALWLTRRSGLFRPGSTTRDSAGKCSRLGLVPSFKPGSLGHATYTLATLYANAAYKRHLAARGNAQRVLLDDGHAHERLARQARSWGVELSA